MSCIIVCDIVDNMECIVDCDAEFCATGILCIHHARGTISIGCVCGDPQMAVVCVW